MDKLCITTQTLPVDSVKTRSRTLYKVTKDNSDFKIALDIYTNDNECPRVSPIFHSCFLPTLWSLQCISTLIYSFASQLIALPPAELGALEKPRKPRQKKSQKIEEEEEESEEDEEDDEDPQEDEPPAMDARPKKRRCQRSTDYIKRFKFWLGLPTNLVFIRKSISH